MKAEQSGTDGSLSGRCLCGAVQFEVRGAMRPIVNCYCGQCQRTHGTGAAYSQALNTDLHMLKDTGLKWFRSSGAAERGFCHVCGSSLFWRPLDGERTSISAGCLDQPAHLHVGGHIYVASAPAWMTIPDDGMPRFQGTSAGKLDGDLSV